MKKDEQEASYSRMRYRILGMEPPPSLQVGYRKPPAHTQFKKGTSGNPKGRPKTKKEAPPVISNGTLGQSIRKALEQKMLVTKGGEQVEMTVLDAVPSKIIQLAMNGSNSAMRILERAMLRAEEEQRAIVRADHEKWKKYCDEFDEHFERCTAAGMQTLWITRPEDIRFPEGEMVQIRGPRSPSEYKQYDQMMLMRSAYLVAHAWYMFKIPQKHYYSRSQFSNALFHVHILNVSLPKRLVWTGDDIVRLLQKVERLPAKKLKATLVGHWKICGKAMPADAIEPVDPARLEELGFDPRMCDPPKKVRYRAQKPDDFQLLI